jgi:hypothetical protein
MKKLQVWVLALGCLITSFKTSPGLGDVKSDASNSMINAVLPADLGLKLFTSLRANFDRKQGYDPKPLTDGSGNYTLSVDKDLAETLMSERYDRQK